MKTSADRPQLPQVFHDRVMPAYCLRTRFMGAAIGERDCSMTKTTSIYDGTEHERTLGGRYFSKIQTSELRLTRLVNGSGICTCSL